VRTFSATPAAPPAAAWRLLARPGEALVAVYGPVIRVTLRRLARRAEGG
jgi:hypothetical protein